MTGSREDEAARRLRAEYETARALAESGSVAAAAPRVLAALGGCLGWEFAVLWRRDRTAGLLRCLDTWRPSPHGLPDLEAATRAAGLPLGAELPGRAWARREPVSSADLGEEAGHPRGAIAAREGLRQAVAVPILAGEEVLGVLEGYGRDGGTPDEALLEVLATVGGQIGQFGERQRAEAELATLFEVSRDMLVIAGFDGYLRRLNPAWERTLGFSVDEIRARPYLDLVHPDDRAATLAEGGRVAEGKGSVLFENRYRCRDGSYRWLSWSSTSLPEEGLIVASVRDVTEARQSADALRQAREAAEAANRAKGEFLANVSHEIRTPMNAVIGMAELLLDTRLSADQRDYLLTLKDSAESLLGLLNDILDFSKIEEGRLDLVPAPFDLRELLGDTLRTLGLRAHQKGLELVCRVAPDLPERLVGDAARLRQVVVNLVGNAIKFTPRGEVLVEVEKESETAREMVLGVLVADTGIGIARDRQVRIFEAFEQADSSTTREYGGTGLGLTISSRLVGMMGGSISVDSGPGRGSRFRFDVRLGLPDPGETAAPRRPARLRDLRVLVVDDNATNRRILVETLRHWRMRPAAVEGGRAALAELERARRGRRPYALVLLDANMPGMDGFALAARIKEEPRLAAASIMMLTSGARPGDRARCLELGVAGYLTKPVKQSELMDAIMSVLGGGPSRRPAGGRPPSPKGRRLRVLVAEDNPVNQQVAAGLLERAGHTAVLAANGREALALLQRDAYDLVLMDVQMPELDGLETTAAIRGRERGTGAHLPIVAVTAHAMKGDAERCLAAGMDAYVAKPLLRRELLAAIRRLTGSSPAAPGKAAPGRAALDEARLLERVGGDRRVLAKLVRIFRPDARRLRTRIRVAVAKGDPRGLRDAAHALKGSVSNFAAPAATAAASRLQEIGDSGDLAAAKAALAVLERELDAVDGALAALVAKPIRRGKAPAPPRKRSRR